MSAGAFTFTVTTPDGVVARGECDFLVVPTTKGEMGVLAEHAPVVATVAAGELRVHSGGRETRYRVGPGLAEVLDNSVRLFVEDVAVPGGPAPD